MKKQNNKVQWFGLRPQARAKILQELGRRLDACAVLVQNETIQSFGSPPPQPFKTKEGFRKNSSKEWKRAHHSAPNEPPYVQTGHLKRSIGFDRPTDLTRRVGSGIGAGKKDPGYAFFLEYGTIFMRQRPFLRPAMARLTDRIRDILSGREKVTA